MVVVHLRIISVVTSIKLHHEKLNRLINMRVEAEITAEEFKEQKQYIL